MQELKTRYHSLREALRFRISLDREITKEAVEISIVRIFWTGLLMSQAHFFAALGFWSKVSSSVSVEAIWQTRIMLSNFSMAVFCLIVMTAAWWLRKKETSHQVRTFFLYAVIVYVLSSGLLLSVIDQLVIPSITALIISVVIVGTFYYIPPKNSFLIFFLFFLCFRFIFINFNGNSEYILSSNLTNGMVACLMGFSLSFVNWRHFRQFKQQQRTITEQQGILAQMAYQDVLTGLPNRRWMNELMKSEVALVPHKRANSSLIILDIDNFKYVNDTYGHPVGDTLLRDFANLLRENIRDGNSLARIGGEEFVILLRSTSVEGAIILAERLRTKVAEHIFKIGPYELKITASFGASSLSGLETEKDYFACADQALYRAKQTGKNRVEVFYNA